MREGNGNIFTSGVEDSGQREKFERVSSGFYYYILPFLVSVTIGVESSALETS